MRGRFSVDRRSPSMLLYGTLSLFRTNFAGRYAGCGDVSPPAQGTKSGPFEIHVYLAVKKGKL